MSVRKKIFQKQRQTSEPVHIKELLDVRERRKTACQPVRQIFGCRGVRMKVMDQAKFIKPPRTNQLFLSGENSRDNQRLFAE
jgi:hypothetical protein